MIDPCSLQTKPLLSVDEALIRIKTALQPVSDSERVTLKSTLGRVLSEDVYSTIDIPHDRNSAMDGFALSSRDINSEQPFTLPLAGTSLAGKPYQNTLQPGQCVRIFTGAVVPDGADSVVVQEQVCVDGNYVTFPANCRAYQNIRAAGEDIKQDGLLCPGKKKLAPADLGLLAAAGLIDIPVRRKLNIAFFSTGDELISLGQPLKPGKIYDSNLYTLTGLLADPSYNAIDMGVIPDDPQLIETALQKASAVNDVIITTGGASVGDADFIHEILAKIGEVNFWKVAIKPGKPLAFGKIGECYFFGLPGNPVSVLVTFQQLVAPALRQLSGAMANKPLRFLATCTTPLKRMPGRQEYLRGILAQGDNGAFFVASAGRQGSHILSSMSNGNCYIILPAEASDVIVGEQVWVEPFGVFT